MVRSTCSRTAAAILRNVSREKATCRWQPTFQQRCLQTDARSQQILARQVPLQSSRLSRPTQQSGRIPIAAQVSQSQRKNFSTTPSRQHGDLTPPKPGEERKVTFIDKDLQEHTFEVADGDNLLDIAQANDLEMEGACGGSCACSTCHVIVTEDEMFDKMVRYRHGSSNIACSFVEAAAWVSMVLTIETTGRAFG